MRSCILYLTSYDTKDVSFTWTDTTDSKYSTSTLLTIPINKYYHYCEKACNQKAGDTIKLDTNQNKLDVLYFFLKSVFRLVFLVA